MDFKGVIYFVEGAFFHSGVKHVDNESAAFVLRKERHHSGVSEITRRQWQGGGL